MGIEAFGRTIKNVMSELFPSTCRGWSRAATTWCWPTAIRQVASVTSSSETVVFEHLYRALAFPCARRRARTTEAAHRCMLRPMSRMIDGKPGFLVHPRCRQLVTALQGGWAY